MGMGLGIHTRWRDALGRLDIYKKRDGFTDCIYFFSIWRSIMHGGLGRILPISGLDWKRMACRWAG
jgi:hypothetical protein